MLGAKPTGATPWLACLEKRPAAKFRCVMFSWTGNRGGQGSAHNFRRVPLNWATELSEFEVLEVLQPGRATRMKEELFTSTPALVAALASALAEALEDGAPYAFVGFAFGAVLAWEVARAIAASRPGQGPALLCAVSAEGPSWPRAGKLHAASEAEFRRVLTDKGGTDFILKDQGMSKMYLPVIRADLQLEEQYAPPADPAAVPTLAFVGLKEGRDKERSKVQASDAALWVEATRASASRVVEVPDADWYVLQEVAGAHAVMREVNAFMSALS